MFKKQIITVFAFAALALAGCSKTPEELLIDANNSVAVKDHPTAIVTLKNLLQEDPNNVEARLMLARSSLVMADPLSAEKELQRAADLGEDGGEFMALYYRTQLTLGRNTNVLELLADENGLRGLSEGEAKQFRGEALLGLGSSIEAGDTFAEILASEPDNMQATWGAAAAKASQGESRAAAEIAARLTNEHPEFARGWLIKGQLALRDGRLDAAAKDLMMAVDTAAATPDRLTEIVSLGALGDAQLGLRDVEGAETTVRRLAPLTGPSQGTRLLVARLAIAQEDLTAASGELDQLLASNPDNAQAAMLLASVQITQKNYAQAKSLLERVLSLRPGNLAARRMLAATLLGMDDDSSAAAELAPLLEDSDDSLLSIYASQILLESGKTERAVEVLEDRLVSDPDNNELKMRLAGSYLSAGRADDARSLAEGIPDGVGFQKDIVLAFSQAMQGNIDESQVSIERVIDNYGDDVAALTLAADYYERRGNLDRAQEILGRAVTLAPTDAATLFALARIEYRTGDLASAGPRMEEIVLLEPDHMMATLSLADMSEREGDFVGSKELILKAVEIDPSAATPQIMLAKAELREGNTIAAERAAHEAARLEPETAGIVAAAASVFLDTGNAREAQGLLSTAVKLRPDASGYWFDLARAQSALEERLDSRKSLEEAFRLSPDSIRIGSALATLEAREGHGSRAMEIVESIKTLNPKSLAPLSVEADILTRLNRHVDANVIYARIFDENPSGLAAVQVHNSAMRAGLSGGHSILEGWVVENPGDGLATVVLAQFYERSGETERAMRLYESAVSMDESHGVALNNLAWLYHEGGDARAEETARRAFEIYPESANVLDTLGWILASDGKYSEALDMLEKAVAIAPESRATRFHLAVVLNKLGDADRSAGILERLLSANSPFGERADAELLLAEIRND